MDGSLKSASNGEWYLVIDPVWRPVDEHDEPPTEAVVGGWFLDTDGVIGLFEPNPDYEPSRLGLPTDPVDAVLQLVVDGEADDDVVLGQLPQVRLGLAVDNEGRTVIAPAPDDVLSALVTTAPIHRERVQVDRWQEVTIRELIRALPNEGVDVLLNPGAPASMRIQTSALKQWFTDARPVMPGEPGPP